MNKKPLLIALGAVTGVALALYTGIRLGQESATAANADAPVPTAATPVVPAKPATKLALLAGEPAQPEIGSVRFNTPIGLARDGLGNTYVIDTGNHLIRKIDPQGLVTTLAGQAPDASEHCAAAPCEGSYVDGQGSAARFRSPRGIAVDGHGNVYVSDGPVGGGTAIRRITPEGTVSTFAGSATETGNVDGPAAKARFGSVLGLVALPDGTLYATDFANQTLRKITPDGKVSTYAGTTQGSVDGTLASAQFNGPTAITRDAKGNLYVTETGRLTDASGRQITAGAVRKISPEGKVSTLAEHPYSLGPNTPPLDDPQGIAVDSNGMVYVSDAERSLIYRITPRGRRTVFSGSQPGNADGLPAIAAYNAPSALLANNDGSLLLADSLNNIIRHLAVDGSASPWAGINGPDTLNGSGAAARFVEAVSLSADGGGNVFVADQDDNSIRRVSRHGDVSTVINTASSGLSNPRSVCVDHNGNVWIAGDLHGSPALFEVSHVGQVMPALALSGELAADRNGNVYVYNAGQGSLTRIQPDRKQTVLVAGGKTPGPAIHNARAFAVDGTGNVVYFALGSTLQALRRDSSGGWTRLSLLAGAADARGLADGPGGSARFAQASSLSVDRNGNLLVADAGNHAIRRVSPGGQVSTVLSADGGPSDPSPAQLDELRAVVALPDGQLALLNRNTVLRSQVTDL